MYQFNKQTQHEQPKVVQATSFMSYRRGTKQMDGSRLSVATPFIELYVHCGILILESVG